MLAATLIELAETGYAGLTVDGVAHRSGVHKTTVYRRWKDRENLVADAVITQVATDVPLLDSQDVDTDLRDYARALVAWLRQPAGQALLAALLSDAARIPQLAEAKHRFFADRFRHAAPMVAAAITRGQLPADTDPAELIRTVIAPIYLRLLVTAEPVDDAIADQASRVALAAARAGLLNQPAQPSFLTSDSKARSARSGTPNRSSPYGNGDSSPVRT